MQALSQTRTGATGPYFRWEIPTEQIEVVLHLNLVQAVAGATIRAGSASAAGLLLGRVEYGRQAKVIIEGHEAATPEKGAPESPFKDQQFVASCLESWQRRAGRMSVIGFYRTCGKEGAALNRDDLKTLERSTQASQNSGSRVRVGQDPSSAAPNSDFMDAAAIARREFSNSPMPMVDKLSDALDRLFAPSCSGMQTTRTAEAVKAKMGLREEGSERIFLVIEPCGSASNKGSFYLTRNGTVLCQSPRIPFSRAELSRIGFVRQAPGASIQDLNYRPSEASPEFGEQIPHFPTVDGKNNKKPTSRGWVVAGVVLTGIVGLGMFRMSGPQVLSWTSPRTENQNERQLGLQVQRKGSDWEIVWDQSSYALRQAKVAHLRITDDFIHKDIELSPSELRNGRILYSPNSDNVVIAMETESAEPTNNAREIVRLVAGLLPTPAVAGTREAARLGGQVKKPIPVTSSQRASSSLVPGDDANSESAAFVETSVKSPNPVGNIETNGSPLEPLWKLTASTAQVPLSDSGTDLTVLPEEAPRLIEEQPEMPRINQEPLRKGGNAVPAELISRINPIYPEEAKGKKIEGNVELQFKISRDGEVKNLVVKKGDPLLAEAARRAVLGWRYKPALLDGSPTEAQGQVAVNFRLN
jgi:TonB family protein